MLRSLSIQNIAVLASLDVHFGPGLTALTGETGAGKSVVLAALGLVLGARGSAELLRTGAESASVEATFSLEDCPEAAAAIGAIGLPSADTLHIRRTLSARGAGRATVNGRPVVLGALAALGRTLVDIAGQHDQQRLLDPDEHLRILDRAGGLDEQRAEMAERWAALGGARRVVERLEERARHAEERAAWLRYQVAELESLALRPGEVAELLAERSALQHAVETGLGARQAEALLYSGEGSATDQLGRAEAVLRRLVALDPSLVSLADALAEARYPLEDAARALAARGRVHADPRRLEAVENRLAEIERQARKHRCSAEDLVLRAAALSAELAELAGLDESSAAADEALAKASAAALACARRLHDRRKEAATRLASRIEAELGGLAMPDARLAIALLPLEEGEALPGGERVCETGLDRAELLLSANPGEDLRPLHRVASGGELSRVLLALKLALRALGGVRAGAGTAVFDEVDAGLGGETAEVIGQTLRALSAETQVICVTHLAPIAALADHHSRVRKGVSEGRTRSEIQHLEGRERVGELCRMLGGGGEAGQALAARLLATRAGGTGRRGAGRSRQTCQISV